MARSSMELVVNEFKWASEYAQEDIKSIWKQIRLAMTKLIVQKLQHEKIIATEGISLEPDWTFETDWKIITWIKTQYNNTGNMPLEEKLEGMKGRLFVIWQEALILEPSFPFVLDKPEKKILIDTPLIKRIIAERKGLESESASVIFGPEAFSGTIFTGQSGEQKMPSRLKRDLEGAFKYVGNTKEEINIIMSGLAKEGWPEDASLEGLFKQGMDWMKDYNG